MFSNTFNGLHHFSVHFYFKRVVRKITDVINRNIFYMLLILLVSFFLRGKKVIG